MKKNGMLYRVFLTLTLLLSHAMCAVIAYDYCATYYCGKYEGCSAPASIAFFGAIPFGVAIVVCGMLTLVFAQKRKCSE